MIEIVVSMLLLSLLAIAFLPMLVTSLRVSVSNATLASATQIVAAEMDNIRSLGMTCTDVQLYASDPAFDLDGHKLQSHFDGIDCTGSDPKTVKVRVYVTEVSTSKILAQASTRMFVNG